MTARTCPVHGEYSATGVCRWCEPNKPVSLPGLKGPWQKPDRIEVNEAGVPTYTFILTEKTADEYRWRLEWTEAVVDFDANAIQESLLAEQHAALRWERVARRWNYKHRRPGGLDEEGRAYVWRCWLEQRRMVAPSLSMLDLARRWGILVNESMREHVEKLARTNPFLFEELKP